MEKSLDPPAPETRIAADIEELRRRCADTRTLYREVCGLLFFRYGITPTANRLYQYVRKGSMGTPAQVLGQFWEDLRERTRVRIDHPDLPDVLKQSAAELVSGLWTQARQEALRSLDARAAEAGEAVEAARLEAAAARTEAQAARGERDGMRARLDASERALAGERAAGAELARELATIRGRLASMTEMLVEQGEDMRALRAELAGAQRDVARAVGEANALRVQLALAKRRSSKKPLGGVPEDPDTGQDHLDLDAQRGGTVG